MTYFTKDKKSFNPQPKIPSLKGISKNKIQKAFKKISISKLIKDLDQAFNAYIRKRDEAKPCISCNKFYTKRNPIQAGHYHSCRYKAIRWDEQNVNGQCFGCNIGHQGNFHGYTKGILLRYGNKVLERLEMKMHNPAKLGRFELQLLINEYKLKTKNHGIK